MSKIEIKSINGSVLFEYEKENNNMKDTIKEAIKQGKDLSYADLRSAYLIGTDLRGANLKGADLRGANLSGTHLEGANLKDANLEGANLKGAYLYISNNTIEEQNIIQKIEENSNIKIKKTYLNKNIIPTRYSCFWKYGLAIDEYEIVDKNKEENVGEFEFDIDSIEKETNTINVNYQFGSNNFNNIGNLTFIDKY